MLGDAEYDHVMRAVSKANATMYAFVKEAIMRHADLVLQSVGDPILQDMVTALQHRKWTLYQKNDFTDNNNAAWLKTRFPKALEHQIREAISLFRQNQFGGR